jgi:hypothetical protein
MNKNNWLGMLGVVGLVGCGVSNQDEAVEAAARNSCAVYVRCGDVGSGRKYVNERDCLTDQRDFWNVHWSLGACDARINSDSFDFCMSAIRATTCDSYVDDFLTRYDKCSEDRVCSGRR